MTNIDLSFEDLPYVCRLCSTKKENLYLLNHLGTLGLMDILRNIITIKIESDDDLPNKVCHECTNKLQYISSFISLCINSETNLKDIVEKHRIEAYSQYDDLHQTFSPFENTENNLNKICGAESVKYEKTVDPNYEIKNNEEQTRSSTKRKPSSCEVCGQYFTTRTTLYEHKKKNISCRVRPFKCTNCDKAFFTKFKLKLHTRSHTKETPFECKICLKKFRFASNVNRHVDFVHKGLRPFKCDVCGKGFTRNANLLEHKRKHLDELPFICNYCGLSFDKARLYHYHINLHKATNHNELTCNVCAKTFGSQSSLKKHKYTHTKENIFLCEICGKNFRTNQTLTNHINVHMDVRSFKCKICDKAFSRKSTLEVHSLRHTLERPFRCNMCLKTFAQSVHLKNHERIHNGDKPYQCAFCSRKFSVKCNLVIHTRIHTKDTKYKCTVCGKMYYESRSLKKHMKIHQDSSLIVLTNEDISTLLS